MKVGVGAPNLPKIWLGGPRSFIGPRGTTEAYTLTTLTITITIFSLSFSKWQRHRQTNLMTHCVSYLFLDPNDSSNLCVMVNTSPSGHSDQNRTERERPLWLLLSLPIIRSILQDWVNRLSSSFDLWLLEAQLKFVWKPNKYWSQWLESPFPLSAQARVTPSKHLSAAMQQIAQQFSFPLCILFFNRVLYNFFFSFLLCIFVILCFAINSTSTVAFQLSCTLPSVPKVLFH